MTNPLPSQSPPDGPRDASILIVGEAFGADEALRGKPFIGPAGRELTRMLHDAGIARTDCLITNVVNVRPPANNIRTWFDKWTNRERIPGPIVQEGLRRLYALIQEVRPKLIIALGETALWAISGETGIMNWRGSQLWYTNSQGERIAKLVPTIHPAAVLRQWSWRFLAVHDLKRARAWAFEDAHREPEYTFHIRPIFEDAVAFLEQQLQRADSGPIRLSFDVETRAQDLQITCFGIGTSAHSAMCIPITSVQDQDGYWTQDQETTIIGLLTQLFRHPNIRWVLQNAAYDFQWTARLWGTIPRELYMDTMLTHHVAWSGLPKSLDFLSSLYCDYHRFWKNEGADFHKSLKTTQDEDLYWRYNCKDCCTTWEVSVVLEQLIEKEGLWSAFQFQHTQFWPVLKMMLRGVRIDTRLKDSLRLDLMQAMADREQWMQDTLGQVLNPRSPKQMQKFFYQDLGLPTQYNRKSGRPTCDAKALAKLAKREILIRPVVEVIEQYRSLGVFLSTFINARLDHDKRMRCSYNLAGTETFRYSSSSDAFGYGTNLQNLPKGDD